MNKEGALAVAEEVVGDHEGNLRNCEGYLAHLGESYDIAGEKALDGLNHYPDLPLDADENALAGGWHDIGRPLRKNQLFHELRGWRFIKENGLKLGIADNQAAVDRIADMMRPHGYLYERWMDVNNADARKEFEQSSPIDTAELLPRTWAELIVMYADEHNANGEKVTDLEQRHNELLERYADDETVMRTIRAGQLRVRRLCELVDALANGELREGQVNNVQPLIDKAIEGNRECPL